MRRMSDELTIVSMVAMQERAVQERERERAGLTALQPDCARSLVDPLHAYISEVAPPHHATRVLFRKAKEKGCTNKAFLLMCLL